MSGIQVKNICGLSPVQEGMYFHYLMNRTNDPYVIQSMYELNGQVDAERLKAAFEVLVQRHDCLRTLFMHQKTPDPVQIVLKSRDVPFDFSDLRHIEDSDFVIQEYLKSDRAKGFDLARDPLVRLHLFHCKEQRYRLVMTLHHIILDGWSSGIIERELFMVYAGDRFRSVIDNSAPISFAEYIKWLKTQSHEQGVEYFVQKLRTITQFSPFTHGRKKKQGASEDVYASTDVVSGQDTRKIKSLASDLRVTPADLLRSIWSLTVARFTGHDSFTTLHTVSGRPTEMSHSSDLVGMFINAMVQPYLNDERSIRDVVRHQHELFAASLSWQHVSLSQIAKSLSLNGELSDNLVVLENYPEMGDERAELENETGFSFTPVKSDESTNYPVTIQFHVGSTIEVRFFMKKDWFTEADIHELRNAFHAVLNEVLSDVFQSAKHVTRVGMPAPAPKLPRDPISVYISSNFTDNNLVPYLYWWMDHAGFEASISLADYNTVHQQVTDVYSAYHTHVGQRVILIKISDLARFKGELEHHQMESYLQDSLNLLVDSIVKHPIDGPILLVLTPDHESQSGLSKELLQRVGDQFIKLTSTQPSVKVIDLRNVPLKYKDLFDEVTDHMGHIPYSEAGFSYIASQVARAIRAWKHQPFKVIALDADNTLWNGVLGEDGVNGIEITPAHRYLQEFVLKKKEEGFLLAMCTKNNAGDIDELFRLRKDFVLKQEDFVSIAANWGVKSANLKAIAEDLNVGIDSFIFLDDSALEIREVNESQPDVLALQLPENSDHWKAFLDRIWAFDTFVVTQEDRQRTSMYMAEKKRKQIAASNDNNGDFIAQLDVKTKFYPLGSHNLDRIEQLTQRTNQFNLNGLRFSKSDILAYASIPDHLVYSMSVSDQFGDYGITGALFIRLGIDVLVVDAWMLSCRVLARGVEHHVLQLLRDLAKGKKIQKIRFEHKITPKNAPIQYFLSTDGFIRHPNSDAGTIHVEMNLEHLNQMPLSGSYEVLADYEESDSTWQYPQDKKQQTMTRYASARTSESDDTLEYWVYNPTPEMENHPRNGRYLNELSRFRPDLLEQSRFDGAMEVVEVTPYVEPLTATEIRMAAIWKSLLESDRIGRQHDFFLSGGNSLMATRLASRIYQEFQVEIELSTIFDSPVLSDFCVKIETLLTGDKAVIAPLERVEQEFYPLSAAQHRIWRSEQLFEYQAGYVLGGLYKIQGHFDVEKLRNSLKSLTQLHDSLRTSFPVIDGEPRQFIHNEVTIDVADLRKYGDVFAPEELSDSFFSKKFNLESGPLMEAGYACLGENDHLLAIKLHHLITDGWSQAILMNDLMHLYESGKPVDARDSARFVDFVRWSNLREQTDPESARSFWNSELQGDLERVTLPYDFSRPSVIRESPKQFRIELNNGFKDAVNAFSRKNQLSLYMTMMASLQLLFQKYTGKYDIIIGSPFSGRTHPDVHQTVGFFVNTLPFRMLSKPETDLKSWLNEIRTKTIKLLEFQHLSLDTILSDITVDHDQLPPLFDVLLLVQEQAKTGSSSTDFKVESVGTEHLGAGYDVVFQVFDSPEGWELVIEYQPELYHPRSISMIAGHWKAILSNMTKTSANQPISKIEPFDEALKRKLVHLGAGDKIEYRRQTIIEVFKEAVDHHPNHVALITETNESITYVDLDKRSDHLAHRLLSLGVEPNDRVVVNLDLKSQVIECMLAIMKCRAVYVPVDSETPLARTEYILKVCQPKLWIRDSLELPATITSDVSIISFNELTRTTMDTALKLPSGADPDEMAYIIFTSGSTGRPKGVAVHHQGLINMTHTHVRNTDIQNSDRVLCFASISFDASLSEFLMGLLPGATMVCPPSSVRKDAIEFIQYLNELKVTVVTLPPVFLANLNQPELPYLKSLVTAGEPARINDALFYAKTKRYINAYGPTECSVGTNAHIVHSDATYRNSIPIGRPYDNVQLMVLDESLNLAPFGASGQLAVNGNQVAIGYYGNPELTSKSFINHPLFPGKTYLTGDQVRWNFNGELEFLGRNDTQVKIRGYRIELDEIKHQIDLNESIQVSFVSALTDPSGDKQVIAYIVEKAPVSDAALRKMLSENLPNYMIPAHFVRVDDIKLTINGKVDTKALPNPFEIATTPNTFLTSSTGSPAQQILVETLTKFIPAFNVDLSRTFLQAGGDSIKAIQVAHHLKQNGYSIRAGQLYELDSLHELASLLESSKIISNSRPKILPGIVDCNPMQERFFSEVTDKEQQNLFWMQAGFKLSKSIPVDVIRKMISEIVEYHEIFSMRFTQINSVPQIEIMDVPAYQLVLVNSDSQSFTKEISDYRERIKEYIDIESGRLASFLIICGPDETHIVATFHHLIIDATSLRVLRDQLQWMTSQLESGITPKLDGNYLTQREWTAYIHNHQISKTVAAKWETLFLGSAMDVDRTTPCISSFEIDCKITRTLSRICVNQNIPIDALLLGIAHTALCSYLKLPSLRIGIESQGRKAGNKVTEIGSTMGWFTLEFPIRLESSKDLSNTLYEILQQTQSVHLDGLEAVMTQNRLRKEGNLVSSPELGFNYLGEFTSEVVNTAEWSWDSTYISEIQHFTYQWHAIELSALIEEGKLKVRLQSNTSKLDQTDTDLIMKSIQHELISWTEIEMDSLIQKPVLICFPFVASNASFFDKFKQALSGQIDVVALELPGHGSRIDEPLLNSLDDACNDLIRQLGSLKNMSGPYVWLGHSMGAYLALSCSNRMKTNPELLPSGIIFSDVAAPGQFEKWIVGDMTPQQKEVYYKQLGYDAILESLDDLSKSHFEAIIRSDLGIVRPFVNTDHPTTDIPAKFIYSIQESSAYRDQWITGWQQFCNGELHANGFEGGHIDWLEVNSNADLIKTLVDTFFQEVKHEI